MLPPSRETPRNRYLQEKLDSVEAHIALSEWPKLTEQDHFIIGRLVILYNFVEFNLRRMLEAWEETGHLKADIKGRAKYLRIGAVEKAVQTMAPWPERELNRLKRLAEIRNLRNLVAHFAAKRFPEDDAFLFIAKSEADFKRQFPGVPTASNMMLTAILDGPMLPSALADVEEMQIWLALQSAMSVKQAHAITSGVSPIPNKLG